MIKLHPDVDFLDFGASDGSSLAYGVAALGGRRGAGIDISEAKCNILRSKGLDCVCADLTSIDLSDRCVRFVIISHVLEHLESEEQVTKVLSEALRVATDFVLVRGPYFDADAQLSDIGLKFYWSDWTGHRLHLQASALGRILTSLGVGSQDIYFRRRIQSSADPTLHPFDSPKDQHHYDAETHPPKAKFRLPFPVWTEIVSMIAKADAIGVPAVQQLFPDAELPALPQAPSLSAHEMRTPNRPTGASRSAAVSLEPKASRAEEAKREAVEKRWLLSRGIFDDLFSHFTTHAPYDRQTVVAEFGVGKWGFGRFYAEKYRKVFGVDVEDYSARHPGVEFVLSKDNLIPLEGGSVGIVFSHSVLEHVDDLRTSLHEIDRITKLGGYLYLTVNPLYYSSFGAHMYEDGKRIEDWEHLDPSRPDYLTTNSLPESITVGHSLNKLSSEMFLREVARLPWDILDYQLSFETKPVPAYVDRGVCSDLDLVTKAFRFVGRKMR